MIHQFSVFVHSLGIYMWQNLTNLLRIFDPKILGLRFGYCCCSFMGILMIDYHLGYLVSGLSQWSNIDRNFSQKGSGERGKEPCCCGCSCWDKQALCSWVSGGELEL